MVGTPLLGMRSGTETPAGSALLSKPSGNSEVRWV